jgi:hypothetical protein
MIPWISVVFVVISPFSFLIFANLGLFPPHFSQVCQGLVSVVFCFLKNQLCIVLILCMFFLVSDSLILALLLFLSACFGFCLLLLF